MDSVEVTKIAMQMGVPPRIFMGDGVYTHGLDANMKQWLAMLRENRPVVLTPITDGKDESREA